MPTRPVHTDLDFLNVNRPVNLPAPTADGHPATKGYVDGVIEGLKQKTSCRVMAQVNVNIASPGASIDSSTMVAGDRALLPAQTNPAENGIYVWNGAAVAMTRSLDANTFLELKQAITTIEEGSSAGLTYRQTTNSGTLGVTAISWIVFGTAAPAASTSQSGISRFATLSELNAATPGVVVTPDILANWSGRSRKAVADIGDNSATSFTINHNFGTRDVLVAIYSNSGLYQDVLPDLQRPNANAVAVVFGSAPALNAFRVVVMG